MTKNETRVKAVFNIVIKTTTDMTEEEFKIAVRKAETLATRIRIRFNGSSVQKQRVKHPEMGYECSANTRVLVETTMFEIKKYKKKTNLYLIYTSVIDDEINKNHETKES